MTEKHKCPVCGKYEFPREDSHDFCPVCAWEDDVVQILEPDESGANPISLSKARALWEQGKRVV